MRSACRPHLSTVAIEIRVDKVNMAPVMTDEQSDAWEEDQSVEEERIDSG